MISEAIRCPHSVVCSLPREGLTREEVGISTRVPRAQLPSRC